MPNHLCRRYILSKPLRRCSSQTGRAASNMLRLIAPMAITPLYCSKAARNGKKANGEESQKVSAASQATLRASKVSHKANLMLRIICIYKQVAAFNMVQTMASLQVARLTEGEWISANSWLCNIGRSEIKKQAICLLLHMTNIALHPVQPCAGGRSWFIWQRVWLRCFVHRARGERHQSG